MTKKHRNSIDLSGPTFRRNAFAKSLEEDNFKPKIFKDASLYKRKHLKVTDINEDYNENEEEREAPGDGQQPIR